MNRFYTVHIEYFNGKSKLLKNVPYNTLSKLCTELYHDAEIWYSADGLTFVSAYDFPVI